MYFGAGLAATGTITAFMRNSMFLMNHPFMFMFASLGLLFGTMLTDYQRNPVLKHLMWGGFMGITGLSMVPLIQMASMPIIYDALFATGLTVGGLGLVAYNAPSE
jgi:FtsH-binding integral membrane protein